MLVQPDYSALGELAGRQSERADYDFSSADTGKKVGSEHSCSEGFRAVYL